MLAQVAIADAACILALPLAIDPHHAGGAALGALAVLACATMLFVILGHLERVGLRRRMHQLSKDREFALELRTSLAILFTLAALATRRHVRSCWPGSPSDSRSRPSVNHDGWPTSSLR